VSKLQAEEIRRPLQETNDNQPVHLCYWCFCWSASDIQSPFWVSLVFTYVIGVFVGVLVDIQSPFWVSLVLNFVAAVKKK
jgi:hypothetical protein